MKVALLLALLSVGECGSSSVVGRVGHNVTLDCKYDISRHKKRSVCWNRGEIPSSGCSNQLVATGNYNGDGTRGSSRYLLLGQLDQGDVSLTIVNLTEADAGRYGCRVDIFGWFNDEKHHFDLTVEGDEYDESGSSTSAPSPQTTASADAITEASPQQTADDMTYTDKLPKQTSLNISPEAESSSSPLILALVFSFFCLVALITAGGFMVRRWQQVNKVSQVSSVVQFNSTTSTLYLQSQVSAVENIYQIDGSEYEQCP